MQYTSTLQIPPLDDTRAIGIRSNIAAIREAVEIERYASELTQLRNNRGRCPVHGGQNRQSFTLYPEQGRFTCFSCGAGGDVLDLYRAVEGGELHDAIVGLSQRFGVELPGRPESWHQWNSQKARTHRKIRDALIESYRRRLFRAFFTDYLQEVEPAVRDGEARELWEGLWTAARELAEGRMAR